MQPRVGFVYPINWVGLELSIWRFEANFLQRTLKLNFLANLRDIIVIWLRYHNSIICFTLEKIVAVPQKILAERRWFRADSLWALLNSSVLNGLIQWKSGLSRAAQLWNSETVIISIGIPYVVWSCANHRWKLWKLSNMAVQRWLLGCSKVLLIRRIGANFSKMNFEHEGMSF